jgi:predicted transposase YbfD/YdcC
LNYPKWVSSINKEVKGVVAIDGKTIKGSKQNQDGEGALHIVSAFAYEIGIVLGQEKVADKSNEITAIPNLLERLAIEGAVVTIDAMGAQKDIVSRIIDKKADYLLGLKGNQKNLYEDVKLFFEEKSKMVVWDEAEEVDAGHGRVEIRSSIATSDIDWLKERHPDWKNLKSIVKIESGRYHKKTGKETRDVRYYISSLPAQALNLLKYSRAHWSIENSLHWSLDVIFREDSCRTRADYLGENMAIIRKTAFNLLKRDNIKLPLKRRRVKALIDPNYRSKLIFH